MHRNIAASVACRRFSSKALCPINCQGTSAAKVSLCGGGASSCSSMSLGQLTRSAAQSVVHEVQGGTLLALPVRSDHDSRSGSLPVFPLRVIRGRVVQVAPTSFQTATVHLPVLHANVYIVHRTGIVAIPPKCPHFARFREI